VRELTPELRALHDLARAAAQGRHEVEDLLHEICASVVETFGFQRASVARYDAGTGTVSPVASHGRRLGELPERIPLAAQPILRRALESGEAVFVADVREEPALSPELVRRFGIRSLLAVPLVSGGECLGFLAADRGGEAFELDGGTLDVLTTVGAVAAVFLAQAIEQSELRRLDEVKSSFIALASHELRTPAAVVHGIAATLHHRGDQLEPAQLRHLRRGLYEQTERLRNLIEQLLDLSRLEARAITIAPEPLRVHRRIQEIVQTHAGDRRHEIRIDVPPSLEPVVDSTAFDRIVSNLIMNALKHGQPPVIVGAGQSDGHFRLAVEDRGVGVDPEFVPRLFERFSRDQRSTVGAHGAGLGLSIARSYAEAHGGDILYRPAEPHGACFELVLPSR
jgi:signal transduction histidine kinase